MTDALDRTFARLQAELGASDRLTATHADPFFNFVHDPQATLEVHKRLPRWRAALEQDGWRTEVCSLREALWSVIDASGRWEDWLALDEPGRYAEANQSVRGVLGENKHSTRARPGLARTLAPRLQGDDPRRILLLTDAALLHPWFRVRTLETWFHDALGGPTVLFYPGRRVGDFGLLFLGVYPEDDTYRSTIVGEPESTSC